MKTKTALITVGDNRDEFYKIREPYVLEQIESLRWLDEYCETLISNPVVSEDKIPQIVKEVTQFGAHSILMHIPIWAPPSFTLNICRQLELPVMLIGNSFPQTSSTVGILGAGGALDQIGIKHIRIFDKDVPENRNKMEAFVTAASVKEKLLGQKYAKFGSYALGIFTAEADPAQWQKIFGIETITFDQLEIVDIAESFNKEDIKDDLGWFISHLKKSDDMNVSDAKIIEKQVRSYLAMVKLIKENRIDFVGVKCQPELSNGYVTQCVAHMLLNSSVKVGGKDEVIVHACESDSDGALTMQILKLLSKGSPTALLDIRFFDEEHGTWIFANCGAMACDFYGSEQGINEIEYTKHVFGKGRGFAYPGKVKPQDVTLARLSRNSGEYKMTVIAGTVEESGDSANTTKQFPQARIRLHADNSFLNDYGSNHIHMVSGNYVNEIVYLCDLLSIKCDVKTRR